MSANPARYQFHIFESNEHTTNSAATKAVADCSLLFSQKGYHDRALVINNNARRGIGFYATAFAGICKLLLTVRRGALVGIQYPMLNNVFKYFIRAGRLKRIKFFCIVHDVESLRLGGKDEAAVAREAANFNYYDCLIVHNNMMKQWLINHGVTTKMVSLGVFDYVSNAPAQTPAARQLSYTIAYAGNLAKSRFVYLLADISRWKFNLYGPNYQAGSPGSNFQWEGVFSPEQIVSELKGDFGLIWDGDSIDKADKILGNYLKYNNPHKFSLYLAAGLPVIAPADSAIANVIKQHRIGVLIRNLYDLQHISITQAEYDEMKKNVISIRKKVIKGGYFLTAIDNAEKQLLS